MDFFSVLFIAFSLSADCFAVCISAGATNQTFNVGRLLKVAFAFGLAQFLMTVLGWFAGSFIEHLISPFDHWIAFGLLLFIGVRMIWESFHEKESEKAVDTSKGLLLVTLVVATSIDALAVGLSFAIIQIDIWMAGSIIGVVSFAVSLLGFWLGKKASAVIGKRAELAGGIILILIGLRILLSHLLA
jgi:putative Mn2+ efflux pump MntP